MKNSNTSSFVADPENFDPKVSGISKQNSRSGPGRPPSKKLAQLEEEKNEALKKQRKAEIDSDYQLAL
jgi:hypothetical protein